MKAQILLSKVGQRHTVTSTGDVIVMTTFTRAEYEAWIKGGGGLAPAAPVLPPCQPCSFRLEGK